MKSRGLTFLDDNKSCEGCKVNHYSYMNNTVCPLKKFVNKHNLINECPCIECVIKVNCNSVCDNFKYFIKILSNFDIFDSDIRCIAKVDLTCRVPKRTNTI
jgi:hypothetical protein